MAKRGGLKGSRKGGSKGTIKGSMLVKNGK